MHAGDERIDAQGQLAIGRHLQQGAVVTDIEQDIVARRAEASEVSLDEVEFGPREGPGFALVKIRRAQLGSG
jgi:hypothetical protein